MSEQAILDKKHQSKLYWWGLLLHFALFSFNALATSTLAALIGAKWDGMSKQEHFLIVVAILANWTGVIVTFLNQALKRLASGKAPLETGDTQHMSR